MEVITLYLKEFECNCQEVEGWTNNIKKSNDYKRIKQLLKDNEECITYLQTEMPNQPTPKDQAQLKLKIKELKEKHTALKKEAKLKYETTSQSHQELQRESTHKNKGPDPFKTDNYDMMANDKLIDTKMAGQNAQMMGNEVGIELQRNDGVFNKISMNNNIINTNAKQSVAFMKEIEKFRKQSDSMVFYSYVGIGATVVLCITIKLIRLFY